MDMDMGKLRKAREEAFVSVLTYTFKYNDTFILLHK